MLKSTVALYAFVMIMEAFAFAASAEAVGYFWCYQEFANQTMDCTNFTLDNSGGNYNWTELWNDPQNATDGNWSTQSAYVPPGSHYYFNYTIPYSFIAGNYTFSIASGLSLNYTLTKDTPCINNPSNAPGMFTSRLDFGGNTYAYCYGNPAGLYEMYHQGDAAGIFEEGMYWYLTDNLTPSYNNLTYNFSSISSNKNVTVLINLSDDTLINNVTFQWNCSFGGTVQNISVVNLNTSSRYYNYSRNISLTKNFSTCDLNILVSDYFENYLSVPTYRINITKAKPASTLAVANEPLTVTDDINLIITYSDADNDTWVSNYTKWYKGGIEQAQFENYTRVAEGNTSLGEVWTINASACDLYNCSDWNTKTVTYIGFTVNNHSISPQSMTFGATAKFCLNASSSEGTIASCKFELHENGLPNPTFNITPDDNTDTRFCKTYGSFLVGNVEWKKSYCTDSAGNTLINDSVGLVLSVNQVTGGTGPTGGGSSPEPYIILQNLTTLDCNYDEVCDSNEDFISCPGDCEKNISWLTCSDPTKACFWRDYKGFLVVSVVILLLAIRIAKGSNTKSSSTRGE